MSDGETSTAAQLFVNDGDVRHESVRVAIRVRPLNERERLMGARQAWRVAEGKIIERSDEPNSQHQYAFDHVFDETQSTESVYKTIAASVVQSSMQGINGTIFAYGQTSSGKTHTMMGTRESPGIIPFALSDIFQFIQEHEDREFLLRVSHLEIYNEVIRDLLNPDNTNLKIQENADGNIIVGRLTEVNVRSPAEVMGLLLKGQSSRQTASTNMNEESSRSHSIFRLAIESRERQREGQSLDQIDGGVQIASLNLVDLAGSERVSMTGATGMRLKEGGHINKSLLTLGKCIRLLSEGNSSRHIPFRDSKLTRILASALGGNSFTVIVCAVTPASAHIDETISTIQFASRAKTIQNVVKKNEIVDEQTQIHRLQKEIANLKSRLRRSDESLDLKLQCEDKARQLEEAQLQFERLRKLFIHANNLDLNMEQTSVAKNSLNKPESKRNAILRRRTVDPATFSIPNAATFQVPFRQPFGAIKCGLEPVSEHHDEDSSCDSVQRSSFNDETQLTKGHQNHAESTVNESILKELEFLRKENQSIRDRCARAETNLQMSDFEVKKVQSQFESLQEKIFQERQVASQKESELSDKLENATKENQKMAAAIANFTSSEQQLNEQKRCLENKVTELAQDLERARCDIETGRKQCSDVETQFSQQLVTMQIRLDSSEQLLIERQQQIETLTKEFDEKLLSIEDQRDGLRDQLVSVQTSMQEQITELNESLEQLQAEKETLANDLTEVKQRYAQVASLSASKQEQYFRSANEKALKRAESEVERLKAKIRSLEESALQSKKEIFEMKNQRASMERNLKSMERQISSRESEVSAARSASESLIALQKQVKELQSSEERSKHQIEDHRRQVNGLTEQLNITQAQLERCEFELHAAREEVFALKQELVSSADCVKALREELDSLNKTKDATHKRLTESCGELDKLRQELETVTKKLQTAESSRNDAEENAVQAHFRLEEVSFQLQDRIKREEDRSRDLETQVSTLQQQNKQIQESYASLLSSLNDEKSALAQLSNTERTLRSELDHLNSLLQQKQNELKSATEQHSKLAAQHEDLNEALRSAQSQLEMSQKESVELRAKNAKNIQKCSQLSDELNQAVSNLQALEARGSALAARNATLEERVSRLSHENQQLVQDVTNIHSHAADQKSVQELRKEIIELKDEIQSKSEALEEVNQRLVSVQKNNDKKVNKIMQKFKEYTQIKNTCSNCGAQRDQTRSTKNDLQRTRSDKFMPLNDKENHQ